MGEPGKQVNIHLKYKQKEQNTIKQIQNATSLFNKFMFPIITLEKLRGNASFLLQFGAQVENVSSVFNIGTVPFGLLT